jgi:nucleoside-diphosphate-sugar epimerase
MANLLIVGCGDLGSAIAVLLHQAGHRVIGVRKSAQPLPLNMQTVQLDITTPTAVSALELFKPEIILYCVAATAQDDENYYQHYVLGLQHVLAAQAKNPNLKHVFFVSSTRVYGQQTNALLDEAMPAVPNDFGGNRLLEAEQQLQNINCSSTVLRLSGIYGPGRLYLVNMAKDRARWPQHNQWSNRIHRDDAAGFIAYLVGLVLNGQVIQPLYIVTDSMPTAQYDVLNWLAKRLHVSHQADASATPMQGKRLSNQRLLASGYQLKYPNYQVGYSELV